MADMAPSHPTTTAVAGAAGRLRHDQPQQQPAADRASSATICDGLGVTHAREPRRHMAEARQPARDRSGPTDPGGLALSGHVDTVPVDGQSLDRRTRSSCARQTAGCTARGASRHEGLRCREHAGRGAGPGWRMRPRDKSAAPVRHLRRGGVDGGGAPADRGDIGADSGLRPAGGAWWASRASMQPIVAHKGRLAARGGGPRPAPATRADPGARRQRHPRSRPARSPGSPTEAAPPLRSRGTVRRGVRPAPHHQRRSAPIAGGTHPEHHPRALCPLTPSNGAPSPATTRRRSFPACRRMYAATEIEAAMHAVRSRPAGFSLRGDATGCRAWRCRRDHPLAALVRQRRRDPTRSGHVSYATEGGLYQEAGMATIVCGPGSIDPGAHRPDEWIAAVPAGCLRTPSSGGWPPP